jgi:hypothetical protein
LHHLLLHTCHVSGVACGVIGAFIISPGAFAELVRSLITGSRSSGRYLRRLAKAGLRRMRDGLPGWLSRRLPRRHHRRFAVEGGGAGDVSLTSVVTRGGAQWEPGAPLDRKVELLHENLAHTRGWLAAVEQQARRDVSALHEGIGEAREDVRKVRELLDTRDVRQLQLNARGLPVVAAGVILAGIPDAIASCPHPIGWTLVAVSLALTARAGMYSLWAYRRTLASRKASSG